MRTVSAPMQAATAARVTRPGHLVEISFSSPARLSSVGDVSWNGNPWSGSRFLEASNVSARGGRIVIGNTDDVYTALVQNEGVADRRIRVWAVDGGALGAADPKQIFDGVGDDADIGIDVVTIVLATDSSETTESPRRYADASAGFNYLIPAESVLTIGGARIVLNRERR